VWIEQLETEPSKYLPEVSDTQLSGTVVKIDINQPMKQILNTLSQVSLPLAAPPASVIDDGAAQAGREPLHTLTLLPTHTHSTPNTLNTHSL